MLYMIIYYKKKLLLSLSITIYKDDFFFCVHISKYQFYPLNYLLNFFKNLPLLLQTFFLNRLSLLFFYLFINCYSL